MSDTIKTQDQLRQFMADSLPELLADHPEVILAAMADNAPAMRAAMEKAGFSVIETSGLSPADVIGIKDGEVRAGRLDNAFGSRVKARCDHRVMENLATGKKERVYLWGEREEMAESWFRAICEKDTTDPITRKSAREICDEMEKFVRAPSDPFLGSEGQAGGSLVPTIIAAQIFEEANERFVLKGRVQIFNSASPLRLPRRTAEAAVTRGAQASDIAETKPETGFVTLSPERVGAISYIDPLLAAAAAQGPVRWVTGQLAEAMAKDDQRVIICGTEADREPRGVSNLPTSGGNAFDRAQTAVYDNTSVLTERASMKEGYYAVGQKNREGDRFLWLGNSDALRELTSHNDADQKPWSDERETYLRKQFIETSALLTAAAATTIIGGDFSQYAWLESPMGLQLEQTTVGGKAWESNTIGVKVVQSVDGAPVIPPAFVQITSVDV